MTILKHNGRKIQVWCNSCGTFVTPRYNKTNTLGDDEYNCQDCYRFITLVRK